MLILTIRTDKPEAEVGLYDNEKKLNYITWLAHRELSSTIHIKIKQILEQNAKELKDLEGIAVFKGPGSFTGLRIGISVANALSYALKIPIVSEEGKSWISKGVKDLNNGKNDKIALAEYGALPNITKPRK